MHRNFEFDSHGEVAAALSYDPGTYINDRVQNLSGTRYGVIIDDTAEIAITGPETIENIFRQIAFSAGAILALEALEYSDLPKFKRDYTKHLLLYRGLTKELMHQDPKIIREQIQETALSGLASHPELQSITDRIGEYYVETTQMADMKVPVSLGIGKMAFELDKCYESFEVTDPQYAIARTELNRALRETDWSSVEPRDIIGEIK
jgi:hypothetical protein